MKRYVKTLIGFAVGWLAYVVEDLFYTTAYGGPFAVFTGLLLLPFVAAIFSGIFVMAARLIGLLLTLPKVRDVWRITGYWGILIAVAALGVMIFASKLGLRSIDPVSGYQKMSPWSWSICFFFIVFPIVNLPANPGSTKATVSEITKPQDV